MSLRHVVGVWDTRVGDANAKLVLATLADHATEHGYAEVSIESIASATELSSRTVIRKLEWLVDNRYIHRLQRRADDGRAALNLYRLLLEGVPSDTVSPGPSDTVSPPTRARSVEQDSRSSRSQPSDTVSPGRRRDPIWDALSSLFGEPTTRTARTLRGKTTASLREAGATADEIQARAKRWPRLYEGATLTETALEKHWHQLAPPRRTAAHVKCEECEMGGGMHQVDCSRARSNGAVAT